MSTIAVLVSRWTGGRWVPVGTLQVRDYEVTGDPVDPRLASDVVVTLYRDNVACGTCHLDGEVYHWEESTT
jgi:hypothetical protein